MRVHDFLDYWARERPTQEFAVQGARRLTYQDAFLASNRLAQAFVHSGLQIGDRVAVLAKNSIEYALVYFGASKAGIVPVPLNYRLAPPEWTYIVNDARARMLIVAGEYLNAAESIRDDAGTVERVAVDAPATSGWHDYRQWVGDQPATVPDRVVSEESAVYQMYTSGTTGHAKGAVLTHRAVTANIGQAAVALRGMPGERVLIVAPLFHAAAAVTAFVAVYWGGSLYVEEDFHPAEVVPVVGTELGVVDADDNVVPNGTIGEIIARGPQLMSGYWNRPDDSSEALRGGWMHTGDAGTMDSEGYVYVQDRVKDMVLSGGENIYPRVVEDVLFQHPKIADAAVIGVPDEQRGETVKAIVVLQKGAAATAEEIMDFCRPRLGGFERPRSVEFQNTLPRNPTGKVLKRVLRERYWAGHRRQVGGA